MITKSSIYQTVIKKRLARRCLGKMAIIALKVPFHTAQKRGW